MAGEINMSQAVAAPVTPEDLNRLYEAGALSLDGMGAQGMLVGANGRLSVDDFRATILARRRALSEDPIADCLVSLRKELRDFVSANNREAEGFGFGASGGDPLNCSPVIKRVHDTVLKLEAIGDDRATLTPLAAAQRRVIPQLTAVMQEFLVDMNSITAQGEAGRSGAVSVLKACIHLSRVVGEVVQALSAMKMEMLAQGRAS